MRYAEALTLAMDWLAQDERVLFLGQAVAEPGTAMSTTLATVDLSKRIELPVAEEMQMGMTIGLAMSGYVPVSIYPRWNFLLLAMNQLVNHLDKLPAMGYQAKAIIRVGIGSERPLHPSFQHVGDFTEAVRAMCTSLDVIRLDEPDQVMPAYQKALQREDGRSTVLVEWGDYYSEK